MSDAQLKIRGLVLVAPIQLGGFAYYNKGIAALNTVSSSDLS